VISYIIASIFLFFNYVGEAALGYLFAIFIISSQFFFYWEIFDPFYKKAKGYNVIGKIDPTGEIKQQIIISGHHDSAYVFNFLTYQPKLYGIRIIMGIFILVLAIILSLVWGIIYVFVGIIPGYAEVMRYAVFGAMIFVIPLYFFAGTKGSPGAGDNLIASSIVIKAAELIQNSKQDINNTLEHTRLIFISFDAEEAGLRGARAYVKRHKKELQSLPTYVFNMDSIYERDQIKFFTTDINGTVKLSNTMATECKQIAEKLGYPAKTMPILPGAGATDAAEFAKVKGIEATTLLALRVDAIPTGKDVYHTLKDTVDHIEPDAVKASMEILMEYISKKEIDLNSNQ
jgi:hypothetical protein